MRQPSNLAAARAAWRDAYGVVTAAAPCFRIEAADRTRLYVYGDIGGWDTDAAEFVQAVHAITAPEFDLHLNSPGGFVFDGIAMYEAVLAHPATVTVHIDGLAASAASFLALAGDEIAIAKAGRVMIHDAQGVGIGSAAEMREYADLLDEVSDGMAGIYADRAGGTRASWRKAMLATTWYSSQQAVDAGLAHRVLAPPAKDSGPDNRTRLIAARLRALTTQGG